MKIAITGTFGAGKSSVSEILTLFGYPVLNCDSLAKDYYKKESSIYSQLVAILTNYEDVVKDGIIDINRLGQLFFNDKHLKETIEALIHTQLLTDLSQYFNTHTTSIVEVPLLFEVGWENYFDHVLVVTCDDSIAINRLQSYRNISSEEYEKRMNHQFDKAYKLNHASYIIENNGSKLDLEREVKQWLQKINLSH